MLKRKIVLAGAFTLVGALLTGMLAWTRPAKAQEDYIRTPDRWVPYTVEKQLISSRDGTVRAMITEHKASDGSTMTVQRNVAGTVDPASMDQVTITNRRTGTSYRLANGTWVSRSANPAPHPRMLLDPSTVTLVSSSDERIAAASKLGLSVYEHRNSETGTVNLLCPDLNMLTVWSDHSKAGVGERVTRITLGEPNVTFMPPADAHVELNRVPDGRGLMKELLPSQTARRTQGRP